MRYVPAVLLVWFLLGCVFIVAYNWAKYLYQRRR